MSFAIRVVCAVIITGYALLLATCASLVTQYLVLSTGICEILPIEEPDLE